MKPKMADSSDGEYVQGRLSSDEEMGNMSAGEVARDRSVGTRGKTKERNARGNQARPGGKIRAERGHARAWEGGAGAGPGGEDEYGDVLRGGGDGGIERTLEGLAESEKRRRLKKDTTPLQRGIIRHVVLAIDLSAAMADKDFKPDRYRLTLRYLVAYIHDFFEQNPISQLGIVGMQDGVAKPLSQLSGNPSAHITVVRSLLQAGKDPSGNPSLQNALEMAHAMLAHTPSHGTREVVIVLGALLSWDPGDINDTIKKCVKDKLRVTVIGLSARMFVCGEIVRKTNGGNTNAYGVATDEADLKTLLMATTTPPEIRKEQEGGDTQAASDSNLASLLMMGFPSRIVEDLPTLCACHGRATRRGYLCSRCSVKVCGLPATCPGCNLTLILSTHLARSYHHLFPLRSWTEVSWERARQCGSVQCVSCLVAFPPISEKSNADATTNSARHAKRQTHSGASESGRYECETCGNHFCIDCDVFAHDVLHNCPGCQSTTALP